jgi:head-tail adaptor
MAKWPAAVQVVDGVPVVNVGALRHMVTIQQQGPSSPPVIDAGGQLLSWNEFATAQAAIEAVRGTDVIRGGQTTTQLFLSVTMWFVPGILPNMRLVRYNGTTTYLIQSVENVLEMDVALVLNCIALGVNE